MSKKAMRVVIVSQIFFPEKSAASNRMSRFIEGFKDVAETFLICQMPNYPTGVIPQEYRGMIYKKEDFNGCSVLRTCVIPSDNSKIARRSINYITFFLSSLFFGIVKIKKPNIIIGSSPQLLNAFSAALLAKIKRAKFIFDVRDIWPESIAAMGLMKKGVFYGILEKLELWLYRQADQVLTINEPLKQQIVDKGVPLEKIQVLPNVVDLSHTLTATMPKPDYVPKNWFIALYAGNHSKAQNMKKILQGVIESQKKHFPIFYLFVGHGEEKAEMQKAASEHNLENIKFVDQVDRHQLQLYYSCADVCIASLHSDRVFYSALPTKVLEYMSMSKPVIFLADNYFAEKIVQVGAGYRLLESEVGLLGDEIMKICRVDSLKKQMGVNGYAYVFKYYSPDIFKSTLLRISHNTL